jgi:phosphoribosylanthranilate isomerase
MTSNHRTRVKICGITSVEMARVAVDNGADAIGLVFYPPSPRCVEMDVASEIVASLPAFVTAVGLFVNEDQQRIEGIVRDTKLGLLQFHGNECPDYCAAFQFPYIKAIRMSDDINLEEQMELYAGARSLLLDTYKPGVPGGTGESFNWERVPSHLAGDIILAGGLNPENVGTAISSVRPFAVDVSGGVESAAGVKDPQKIIQFMKGVHSADR